MGDRSWFELGGISRPLNHLCDRIDLARSRAELTDILDDAEPLGEHARTVRGQYAADPGGPNLAA
jgi:hypothetical protein